MKNLRNIRRPLCCAMAALASGFLLSSCSQFLSVADSSLGRDIYSTSVRTASYISKEKNKSKSKTTNSSNTSTVTNNSEVGNATSDGSTSKGKKTVSQ